MVQEKCLFGGSFGDSHSKLESCYNCDNFNFCKDEYVRRHCKLGTSEVYCVPSYPKNPDEHINNLNNLYKKNDEQLEKIERENKPPSNYDPVKEAAMKCIEANKYCNMDAWARNKIRMNDYYKTYDEILRRLRIVYETSIERKRKGIDHLGVAMGMLVVFYEQIERNMDMLTSDLQYVAEHIIEKGEQIEKLMKK